MPSVSNLRLISLDFAQRVAALEYVWPSYRYCLSGAQSAAAPNQLSQDGFGHVSELLRDLLPLAWAAGLVMLAPSVGCLGRSTDQTSTFSTSLFTTYFSCMLDLIRQPWPWYVAGPLIGLTVPALLLIGNKTLGISSSLRHMCAACMPAGIPFLTYNWRAESWNLWFVLGIGLGGFLGYQVLGHPDTIAISAETVHDLKAQMHLTDFTGLLPKELFSLDNLSNWKGWVFLVLGGFLVGFGTRYAGGCTSGHAISGLSNLQWVSLVAVIGFFIGGLLMTWVVYPLLF